MRARLLAVVTAGAAGAALVGYQASVNPRAGPPHVAVALRVAVIVALIGAGIYAQLGRVQRPMGRLLLIAGLFSCVWLLNGSKHELLFSLGFVAAGAAPGLFYYLMLAFPTGRIRSRFALRFIATTSGVMVVGWWLGVLSHHQPLLSTPLLRSPPPGMDVFFIGLPDVHQVLSAVLRLDWLVMSAGTALLVVRAARRAAPSSRALLWPMVGVAVAQLVTLTAFMISKLDDTPASAGFGTAYVATTMAIPFAIVIGLVMQHVSLGRTLARFVVGLGTLPDTDVQSAMATALDDPELKVFYRRGWDGFVDADGRRLSSASPSEGRCQTMVEGAGGPLAVVDFDANLSDHEPYIQAAGKSMVLWLERDRLRGELTNSKRSLEQSRTRLARTADEERRRIQRDLHDGAQQHLIGMHVKLELALEMIGEDPTRCAALLTEVGAEMEATAGDLRSLASEVFPPTLTQFGLIDALRSSIRRMGINARLQTDGVSRHSSEVETQVYFVCLEALQNVAKHGGADVTASLHLWEVRRWLYLEVRDTGGGFDPRAVEGGSGLHNMEARLASVGGRLSVVSRNGAGTVIRGLVPTGGKAPPARASSVGLA